MDVVWILRLRSGTIGYSVFDKGNQSSQVISFYLHIQSCGTSTIGHPGRAGTSSLLFARARWQEVSRSIESFGSPSISSLVLSCVNGD